MPSQRLLIQTLFCILTLILFPECNFMFANKVLQKGIFCLPAVFKNFNFSQGVAVYQPAMSQCRFHRSTSTTWRWFAAGFKGIFCQLSVPWFLWDGSTWRWCRLDAFQLVLVGRPPAFCSRCPLVWWRICIAVGARC